MTVITIVKPLSCLLYLFYCFMNLVAACLHPQIASGLVIPSSAAMMHFSAFSFLASKRCGLVIEPLNLSEQALCFSDLSPKF